MFISIARKAISCHHKSTASPMTLCKEIVTLKQKATHNYCTIHSDACSVSKWALTSAHTKCILDNVQCPRWMNYTMTWVRGSPTHNRKHIPLINKKTHFICRPAVNNLWRHRRTDVTLLRATNERRTIIVHTCNAMAKDIRRPCGSTAVDKGRFLRGKHSIDDFALCSASMRLRGIRNRD